MPARADRWCRSPPVLTPRAERGGLAHLHGNFMIRTEAVTEITLRFY
jgi:hypothetical protein